MADHKAVDPTKQQSRKPVQPTRTPQPAPAQVEQTGLQQAVAAPQTATPGAMLALQRGAGNRAVQRLLKSSQHVQRSAIGPEGGDVDSGLQSQIEGAKGGGRPLDAGVGSQVGGALGADLSGVRVHTDSQSNELNSSLSAQAFTQGSDIFFSQGAYNPGTHSGKQLLAHELTHVVQQGAGKANKVQTKLTVGAAGDKYEQEADQVAQQVLSPAQSGPAQPLNNGNREEKVSRKLKVNTGKSGGVIQRSIFTQARVKMFGQKAGKTFDEVTNPTESVSRVFKNYAAGQNAGVELKFMRDLNRLLNGTVDADTVGAFLTTYNGQLPGVDYSTTIDHNGNHVESQLKKFVRLKKQKNLPVGASWIRSALGEVMRRAETKLRGVVDSYNNAHNRLAAPGAGGWNVNEANVFAQKGVDQTNYTTANRQGAPEMLGAGGVNTVYKHQYQGEVGKQVFKEDQDFDIAAGLHPGTAEGIPEQNPGFAKRSVAMSRLADALGLDVLAKTAFAVSDGQFGTVQSMAKGKAMEKLTQEEAEAVKSDPNFQRAMSKLQMLDIIAGQLDRHGGNYFVQLDEEGNFVALKGIDLDLAFGKNTTANSTKFKAGTLGAGNKQMKKFDAGFVDILIALNPQVIRDALKDLLTDEEINATVQRFTDLRLYLIEVKAGRQVGQTTF